jgi:glutamine synthetase
VPQEAQSAGASAAPHDAQYRPRASAPQAPQAAQTAGPGAPVTASGGREGGDMARNLSGAATARSERGRDRGLPPAHAPDSLGTRHSDRSLREVFVSTSRTRRVPDLRGATRKDILELAAAHHVRFLRLQFTDILGINKNVEIPASQFEKALEGDIMFDGSSIEGFVRIEESDMLLAPDLSTFQVFPWGTTESRVARLICDINTPDGAPFPGDPRAALKRQIARAKKMGFTMYAGMEAEFFLFKLDAEGNALTETHDVGSYFDLAPVDLGEDARRAIVGVLEQMGFEVEAAHHEVAHGQHEIDFRYADALRTADNIATFRFVVKHVAQEFGLLASFMPKPIFGQNGSGMHTHQSLFRGKENAFWDPKATWQLSKVALHYIGGLLQHARGMCAITNPLVNSYKRLVPGYEAPVNVAWSMRNRSPMIRIPDRRGTGTRVELRMPDPAANPYLALTVMLAAGLDGIEAKMDSREPVNRNIWEMSHREKRRLRIDDLPHDLHAACDELEADAVMRAALGEHITEHFLAAKRQEWAEYITQVSRWEIDNYLVRY